jgi:hypothetical protein
LRRESWRAKTWPFGTGLGTAMNGRSVAMRVGQAFATVIRSTLRTAPADAADTGVQV